MQIAMIMKNVSTDNANLVAQMMIIVKRVSSAFMALVFNDFRREAVFTD